MRCTFLPLLGGSSRDCRRWKMTHSIGILKVKTVPHANFRTGSVICCWLRTLHEYCYKFQNRKVSIYKRRALSCDGLTRTVHTVQVIRVNFRQTPLFGDIWIFACCITANRESTRQENARIFYSPSNKLLGSDPVTKRGKRGKSRRQSRVRFMVT